MAAQGVETGAGSARLLEADRAYQVAYFDGLAACFERAAAAVPLIERHVEIAGQVVCLQFAGSRLAEALTRALAHRSIAPRAPDFTIRVWDDESTGTELPLMLRVFLDQLRHHWAELVGSRREIKALDGGRIRTSFFIGPEILSAVDLERNIGLYWIASAGRLPYWERGSPFLALFSWWMASRQRYYVHGGAVGFADGGVLLAGKGGSGKSSTALACLDSNLQYASDDYCLIHGSTEPRVSSIYSTAKLKGDADFARFPHLREQCSNLDAVGDEKALLFLQEHHASRLIEGFPIRAVLLPRVIGHGAPAIAPATAADAFRALAPSSFMQVPGGGPALLAMLKQLTTRVPAFHLDLGEDPRAVPAEIERLLHQLDHERRHG